MDLNVNLEHRARFHISGFEIWTGIFTKRQDNEVGLMNHNRMVNLHACMD